MSLDFTLIPKRWAAVVPHDTNRFAGAIGLYVGGAGVVVGVGTDGNYASFTVQAGQYLVGQFTGVMSTGTTASGIVALYGTNA